MMLPVRPLILKPCSQWQHVRVTLQWWRRTGELTSSALLTRSRCGKLLCITHNVSRVLACIVP